MTFGPIDWLVVLLTMAAISGVGLLLAGRQTSNTDFFLGKNALPWYAVAGSLIATEISAVTFVSLPAMVFRPGGNLTYLQIGLFGWTVSRVIVALVFVPRYYDGKYLSPYDWIGDSLGEGARRMTTALFTLGGVLAQSSRVYLTAVVLEVLLWSQFAATFAAWGLPPLVLSVLMITLFAVVWTWFGGVAAVVWTDVFLLVLFVLGALVLWLTSTGTIASAAAGAALVSGASEAFAMAREAGKLQLFDWSVTLTQPYVLLAALTGAAIGGVADFGSDQLMAQRIFCCRSSRDARMAVLASCCSVVLTAMVAFVGVGLFAWVEKVGLSEAALGQIADQADRIVPFFVVEVLPTGLKGLVVAGVFAAAISSLDSILAALSQTTVSLLPGKPGLKTSRALVLFWGVVLAVVAIGLDSVARRYDVLLDLALSLAGYTRGALLAGLLLALFKKREWLRGYLWAAPFSVLLIFAVVWHDPSARAIGIGLAALWWALYVVRSVRTREAGQTHAALLPGVTAATLGALLIVLVQRTWITEAGEILAWPWYIPLGALATLVLAALLTGPKKAPEVA